MTTLNVGDKFRILDLCGYGSEDITIGGVYQVTEKDEECITFKDNAGEPRYWELPHFKWEKVEEQPKFKVGQIWADRCGRKWKVTGIDDDKLYPIDTRAVDNDTEDSVTGNGRYLRDKKEHMKDLITYIGTDTPHDFEVGKKYSFRDCEGWAKFVAYVPEADEDEQAIFVNNEGVIITRYVTGLVNKDGTCEFDVNTEESIEKEEFVPRVGVWRTRDANQALVLGFNQDRYSAFPLIGCVDGEDESWSTKGKRLGSGEDGLDLIEYLGPLPESATNWGAEGVGDE
jgi:hypothetical protein